MNRKNKTNQIKKEKRRLLLPAICALLLLLPRPAAAGGTSAPERVLVYRQGSLRWEADTDVLPDGSALLSLFAAAYDKVDSADGQPVLAPGTSCEQVIRLESRVSGPVRYMAVLYYIGEPEETITPALEAANASELQDYVLPQGVSSHRVIRAISGTLKGGEAESLRTSWHWRFTDGEEADALDTAIGNADPPEDVTIGLYIVIEDDNTYYYPQTGDDARLPLYGALLGISLLMMILLIISRLRQERRERTDKVAIRRKAGREDE